MLNFTDIFIRRPVLATVVSLLILLAGLRSLTLLQVRQYPQSESAVIRIITTYVGAEAELIKGFITTPLEREIASADGIDYLTSSSAQGVSTITAHLELNYPPYDALTQITAKVNKVRADLPVGSDAPILEVAIGETTSAMYLSFNSATRSQNRITDYLIREVQPQVEAVAGVQQAAILGGRNFAMRIWLDPLRMYALDITPGDVSRALRANNYQSAVGKSKGDAISINLTAATDLHTAREFQELIITNRNDAVIRLKDVATVALGAENYDSSVAYNGEFATFLAIDVLPTANPLAVVREIRDIFPQIEADLPSDITGTISYDTTLYIEDSISEVVLTLVEAAIIVMLVIYLFLGTVRSVLIPIVAIPLSMIGAAAIMLLLGYSLNLLTLLAMVLAIGLVVDDAIIVVENIQRHIEAGQSRLEASLIGARELAVPVIAMTITLFAVYAPIALAGGLTGSLFREFAFTLASAVLVSGIVALTLSPMMCSKMLPRRSEEARLAKFLDRLFDRVRQGYARLLHRSLNAVPVTLVFSALVLVSIYFMFTMTPAELAPTEDQGIILVVSTAEAATSPEQLTRYTSKLVDAYRRIEDANDSFLFNGSMGSRPGATTNTALSGLVLKPWSERSRSQMEIMPEVQSLANGVAGLQSAAFALPPMPGAGDGLPVQFVVSSTRQPLEIYEVGQALLNEAYGSGLFVFATVDVKYDRPQTRIIIDREKAAALGIDMEQLGQELGVMLGGNYINRFSIQGRSYKVIPQVERRYRFNPSQLSGFPVRTASGELVSLATLVKLENSVQPQELKRFQQQNSITLSAVPAPGVALATALEYLRVTAEQISPAGYSFDYAGSSRQYVQEGGSLIVTFFFALVIIYLVLAAQFESFRDPLIMLVSVPLSIAGALLFLTLGAATINIYTQVGLITLIGLISKHGILIVEFANQLQKSGLSKRDAIEKAAAIRLRPILMTTAATVLGVTPLLLADGAGAVSRFNIGLVVATGMSIGTVFTVFVVPAVYLALGANHAATNYSESGITV
jgi:multidrug efflux pump